MIFKQKNFSKQFEKEPREKDLTNLFNNIIQGLSEGCGGFPALKIKQLLFACACVHATSSDPVIGMFSSHLLKQTLTSVGVKRVSLSGTLPLCSHMGFCP